MLGRRRPKLQFSLRICAALITVCACGFAWVRSHIEQYRAEQRLVFALNHSPGYSPTHVWLKQPSGEVIKLPIFL